MERIGGYLVERKLGEGGMGTVYLARTRGGRAVALKVAKAELAADPVFRERFRSEVEAARAVGGFHTAPVVDAALDGDPLWLATAYIPGPTLAERLAAEGAMDEPRLRALGAALAEALESIHSCGLVHRDLKPGNIIMAADGPRVLDFGISRAVESNRLTATGTAFGTPGFLAPEQALGHDVTGAADVFALGAVLVAAAGGSPWGEGTPMGLMYRSVHEPPDVSAVPAALVDVVSACLAKEPADRPSPSALLDLLTDADADTDPGPSDTPPYPPTLTASPAPATPAPAPSAAAPSTPVPAPAVVAPSTPVPAPAVVAPSTPVPAPAVVAPSTPVPAPAVVAPPPPATPPQPPLGSAAPSYQQPVQTATPPHLPAQPATPPHLPAQPATPPHLPAQPATPPHLPAQPATPPHLPAQPAAPQAPYGFGPPIAYGNPYAGPDPEVVLADAGAGVVVNAAGVLLELAGATADFPWNEIARVERSWRGHRLTVTVRLWDGGVYSCELNARRQSRLRAWLAQLDPVLARYLNR
ncbi:protein kinase [Streptomyces sp. 5-8]|uniref:Protein kinase n=1 Tax=Streptomyces musisoli TaxID=2802280 RepID=A0ABS1NYC2_9ACTN|nr:serine/threonine-protein kinase [Streptomyces musisoli]MBL1104785.1 protein kinase [Streptomyces musisoli]